MLLTLPTGVSVQVLPPFTLRQHKARNLAALAKPLRDLGFGSMKITATRV